MSAPGNTLPPLAVPIKVFTISAGSTAVARGVTEKIKAAVTNTFFIFQTRTGKPEFS
jgi:hypothetical protein